MVAVSGRIGAQAGTEEYRIHATATGSAKLVDWFLRGIDQMQKGNYPLAEANFEAFLKAQPNNSSVQQLITMARVAQTPTTVPPTPTPSPVPTMVVTDKAQLFAELLSANDQQQLDKVINLADQLRAVDADYESDTVTNLRYRALVERGLSRLADGDLEAGLYDLDLASSIRDLEPQVQQQRQTAAMYQNAVNYFGADWDKSIELLRQVYAFSPRYRDVSVKLLEAYERSGDAYASVQQWCLANTHYASAVAMSSNARITQKQADAHQKCLTATPTPITNTNGTTATVQSIPGVSGSIVFAAVDPASGSYQLQSFNTTRSQLTTVEVGGSQPAYQRGYGLVAYAFGSAIHGLASNGGIVQLGSFSGAWPSVSPDGTRIAYAQFQNGNWNIFINSLASPAVPVKLGQGSHPVWGPAGKIAYQGCVNGPCGIYIVNPDQPSDQQRITTAPGDISMQWSPDGSHLVYMTNFTGNWEIYTVALANRQFRQITNGSGISADPAWSPDGAHIAFESNRDGSWGLYVVGSEGGEARKLLTIGANHPAWQSERLAWIP
jgi:tetratricopeptide (TPR) repeat protein